jgi:SagB-type dehydrogenase family enzyme
MPVFDSRRFRRSPNLVCYWHGGHFVIQNFATGALVGATPLVCDVLNFFDDWHEVREVLDAAPGADRRVVRRLIRRLETHSLLHSADRSPDVRESAMAAWTGWNPAAGFFHTTTKNVRFVSQRESRAATRRRARSWPVPAAVKRYPNAKLVRLSPPSVDGALSTSLLERRTWRRFSARKLPLQSLGSLLGLTAGVQQWVNVPVFGQVPLKTAPSGGARHPIELYVLASGVDGLRPGLYHYAPDVHALELLRAGVRRHQVAEYLPRNECFARASALVLFTAVFERQLWRYPYARAYRSALIEAGHLAQSFCLVATDLKLAPFCLTAFADSTIERDLGIDGIGESVLYVAGVGCRPRGADWAPLPRGMLKARPNPHLTPTRPGTDR